ncbi:MAG TPA: cytochrome c [Anaerolineae bacterium]
MTNLFKMILEARFKIYAITLPVNTSVLIVALALVSLILAACSLAPAPARLVALPMAATPTVFPFGDEPTPTPLPLPTLVAAKVAIGRQVYMKHCATCHGPNAEGEDPDATGRNAQGFYPAPPHDESGHTWHHPDSQLIDIIKNGRPEEPGLFAAMPAFSHLLSEQEIEAVLTYFKSLWTEEQRRLQAEITILQSSP